MSIATHCLLLCATVLALPSVAASAHLDDSSGFIEVKRGLLSVKLEKVALSDVLRTVGERAGARVSIQGNLGNVQPQVFWGLLLPDGIKRLVQNSNADLVTIYNMDKTGHRYLKEIRAYEGNRNRTFLPAPVRSTKPVSPQLPVQPAIRLQSELGHVRK